MMLSDILIYWRLSNKWPRMNFSLAVSLFSLLSQSSPLSSFSCFPCFSERMLAQMVWDVENSPQAPWEPSQNLVRILSNRGPSTHFSSFLPPSVPPLPPTLPFFSSFLWVILFSFLKPSKILVFTFICLLCVYVHVCVHPCQGTHIEGNFEESLLSLHLSFETG